MNKDFDISSIATHYDRSFWWRLCIISSLSFFDCIEAFAIGLI